MNFKKAVSDLGMTANDLGYAWELSPRRVYAIMKNPKILHWYALLGVASSPPVRVPLKRAA